MHSFLIRSMQVAWSVIATASYRPLNTQRPRRFLKLRVSHQCPYRNSVFEQSGVVIKAEVSTSADNMATGRVPSCSLFLLILMVTLNLSTFEITCPNAHGQSKLASLAIMELQLSSKHNRNGTIRVGFTTCITFRLTNGCPVRETCPINFNIGSPEKRSYSTS
jgi:hypothetical protein